MKKNRSEFDRLLQRYLRGEVTEQERIKIEAWLDSIKIDDNKNLKLSAEEEERIFQQITASTEASTGENTARVESMVPFIFKIAASLLLIAVVSFILWKYAGSVADDKIVHRDPEKTILEDGTIVWLGAGSAISYAEKKEADTVFRYCQLKGTALFEVSKDVSKPFIIDCERMHVRVVGTSFYITTDADSSTISVLTGRVHVSNEHGTNADLIPGQKLISFNHGTVQRRSFDQKEFSRTPIATGYSMSFEGLPLKVVAEKLGKKFNKRIVVSDEIAKCRITADLTDHSLEQSFELISAIISIQLKYEKESVLVTGTSCK